MSRAAPLLSAFNAGELSPKLDGRTDLAKYALGCKRLEGFVPVVQGPAMRTPGTRYVAPVKDSADRCWLLKFEFSATQCFHIEFGDGYCRFFTDHGQLVVTGVPAWVTLTDYVVGDLVVESGVNYYCQVAHTSGTFATDLGNGYWYALTGDIYEIPSPYALADLTNADGSLALQTEQSGDVLYIANAYGTYLPKTLTRFGNTNWQFGDYAPDQGPLLEQNSTSTTITADAQTGSVTLTASASLFAATDVGRLVRLDVEDIEVEPWETGKSYSTNDLARYDGKTYKALGNATSGTAPPIHEQGSAYDGQGGVQWEYQDAGYGLARITNYTNPTTATASVISDPQNGLVQLPAAIVATPTTRWQLGAWSDTTGYPTAVSFFRGRLGWAGPISGVTRLALSVPNAFNDMSPDLFGEVRDDSAITRIIASRDVNNVAWMVEAGRLLIGTGGGEFAAGPIASAEPMSPTNFEIVPQSRHRARAVRPVTVGGTEVWVQRAGRKLMSSGYQFDSDRYVSTDLAVLADRSTRPGIIAVAYQGEPDSVIWAMLSTGALRTFTYDPDQQVAGWARQPIGGSFTGSPGGVGAVIESISTGPTPDGGRDEVWMIAKRTINGQTVRYVEYIEQPWEGDDDDGTPGNDQEDAFYVDSGLTYDGASTTSITGLDHLEGETVQILADGARQPDQAVSGGALTLGLAASVVTAGLQKTSRLVPMRIDAGSQLGTAQGRIKTIDELIIRVIDSLGGKCGPHGGQLDSLAKRYPSTPMGSPPPIQSTDIVVPYPGDYDRDGLIEIVQDEPFPFNVVAIMPKVTTHED